MPLRDKIEHAIQNQPCTVKDLKDKSTIDSVRLSEEEWTAQYTVPQVRSFIKSASHSADAGRAKPKSQAAVKCLADI